jgi:Mg/Co/Ni transporter MgtE
MPARRDATKRHAREPESWGPSPRRAGGRLGSAPIADVMTASDDPTVRAAAWPRLQSLNAYATVREAAHVMASRGLLQIAVRDAQERLVGILTTSDLYRWVAAAEPSDWFDNDDDGAGRA